MAFDGDIEGVSHYLSTNPNEVDSLDQLGNTLLHTACWGKQLGVIGVIMAFAPNVNAIGCHGRTPLHYAVHEGSAVSLPIINSLLAAGADARIKDDEGFTPADWAKVEFFDSSLVPVLKALVGE